MILKNLFIQPTRFQFIKKYFKKRIEKGVVKLNKRTTFAPALQQKFLEGIDKKSDNSLWEV